jgi:hypothetical protein
MLIHGLLMYPFCCVCLAKKEFNKSKLFPSFLDILFITWQLSKAGGLAERIERGEM